jgi:hypothetical protein
MVTASTPLIGVGGTPLDAEEGAGAAPLTLLLGGGGLCGAFFCGSLIGRTGEIYEEVYPSTTSRSAFSAPDHPYP